MVENVTQKSEMASKAQRVKEGRYDGIVRGGKRDLNINKKDYYYHLWTSPEQYCFSVDVTILFALSFGPFFYEVLFLLPPASAPTTPSDHHAFSNEAHHLFFHTILRFCSIFLHTLRPCLITHAAAAALSCAGQSTG
jgi:hypothetical protein